MRRPDEPRVNHRIRVPQIRVIDEDGTQLGILPTEEARRRAEEKGLDLVEVSPTARPPVCKIMDFGKFKYEQKRNAAAAKKKQHQVEIKEVKFRPKTDKHDFEVKLNRVKRFLLEGNKCKVTIMFRGREIVHPEIGHDILKRVAEAVEDSASVESQPRMEGRQMFMIIGPSKGKTKKGVEPRQAPPQEGPEITRAPQVSRKP
jgi:translation initiation factor IF-3